MVMRTARFVAYVVLATMIAGVLAGCGDLILGEARRRARDGARKVKCASNLKGIAQGMQLYLTKHGGNAVYSIPDARGFRGDVWLASLYWTGMVGDPKCFICPSTSDDVSRFPLTRADAIANGGLQSADAVPDDGCSYAGLCMKLRGGFAHRNTAYFTEASIGVTSALASDDADGDDNRPDGMNIVYFDSHVDFKSDPALYRQIGRPGTPYHYLDSGER